MFIMSKVMSKTHMNALSVAVGIICLCVLGFLFFLPYFPHSKEKNLQNLSIAAELMIRLASINSNDSNVYVGIESSSVKWDDGDGYTIRIPSAESFFIAKHNTGLLDRDQVLSTFHHELSAVRKIFTERGFVLDVLNSSNDMSDRSFYDYVQSYRNNEYLCTALVDPDYSSYPKSGRQLAYRMHVSCGEVYVFDRVQDEQIPFLKALDLRSKKMTAVEGIKSGQFSTVSVSGMRGGGFAIVKREGEQYRVLFQGQEAPPCSLAEKEKIPDDLLSAIAPWRCH